MQEAEVQALHRQHGTHKVNLVHPEGNEGVWATFASAEDKAIYESGGTGQAYKAVLMNQPLGWQGKNWGDVVTARTNGDIRPTAVAEDNE